MAADLLVFDQGLPHLSEHRASKSL